MNPWDLIIRTREDLPILADVLHDYNHPGEAVLRRLIDEKKFPRKMAHCWLWYNTPEYSQPRSVRRKHFLPVGLISRKGIGRFDSCTEAFWAIINAEVYKGT